MIQCTSVAILCIKEVLIAGSDPDPSRRVVVALLEAAFEEWSPNLPTSRGSRMSTGPIRWELGGDAKNRMLQKSSSGSWGSIPNVPRERAVTTSRADFRIQKQRESVLDRILLAC